MITRFAPSPTGYLHLGHVYSALMCQKVAGEGRLYLRFEDIDHTRVRPHYYEAIREDLDWLGIKYEETPWTQLDRLPEYEQALQSLISMEMGYPCFCTRKELETLSAPHGEKTTGCGKRCKALSHEQWEEQKEQGVSYAWRLDAEKALEAVGEVAFTDQLHGTEQVTAESLEDVVLARKDIKTSYHIAVVVDDAYQQITDVVRGEDLLASTPIHRVLQALLGYATPRYHHHRLIRDDAGRRLAKRHDDLSLKELREKGRSPEEIIQEVFSHK